MLSSGASPKGSSPRLFRFMHYEIKTSVTKSCPPSKAMLSETPLPCHPRDFKWLFKKHIESPTEEYPSIKCSTHDTAQMHYITFKPRKVGLLDTLKGIYLL